jgi:hypothetical protein
MNKKPLFKDGIVTKNSEKLSRSVQHDNDLSDRKYLTYQINN